MLVENGIAIFYRPVGTECARDDRQRMISGTSRPDGTDDVLGIRFLPTLRP